MIHLKKGREKSLKRRHPWIFSGAIERISGKPAAGETVEEAVANAAVALLSMRKPSKAQADAYLRRDR